MTLADKLEGHATYIYLSNTPFQEGEVKSSPSSSFTPEKKNFEAVHPIKM